MKAQIFITSSKKYKFLMALILVPCYGFNGINIGSLPWFLMALILVPCYGFNGINIGSLPWFLMALILVPCYGF